MDLTKYLLNKENTNLLRKFAFLGKTEDFNRKLNYLKRIAEPEEWDQTDIHNGYKDSTLFYFVVHTFDRIFTQNKIYIDEIEQNAFYNTGLIDPSGNEIHAHMIKSRFYKDGDNYWYFESFLKSTDRKFMELCLEPQQPATYFDDFNELYFDPTIEIQINYDHFYEDNYHRLPETLQNLDKQTSLSLLTGALNKTKLKIKRNNRIPVPQFYENKISFLIPINLISQEIIVIAVEKIGASYRANTVLTMGMAYNCARLLNKPESNWLLNR